MSQHPSSRDQVDQLLWSWPAVCRFVKEGWAKRFAASIARQARNPRWCPSPKQLALMKSMVAEVYERRGLEDGDDFDVVEH